LMIACLHGERDNAFRLLHHGADPTIKANDVSVCGMRGVYGHVYGGSCHWAGPSGDAASNSWSRIFFTIFAII